MIAHSNTEQIFWPAQGLTDLHRLTSTASVVTVPSLSNVTAVLRPDLDNARSSEADRQEILPPPPFLHRKQLCD